MKAVKPYIISKYYKNRRNRAILSVSILVIFVILGTGVYKYIKPAKPPDIKTEQPKTTPKLSANNQPKKKKTGSDALSLNDAVAYNNRGVAYYHKGQYDRAIEDFNKAIALNPNFAVAYYWRGLAYRKIGNEIEAKRDFEEAERLSKKNK